MFRDMGPATDELEAIGDAARLASEGAGARGMNSKPV